MRTNPLPDHHFLIFRPNPKRRESSFFSHDRDTIYHNSSSVAPNYTYNHQAPQQLLYPAASFVLTSTTMEQQSMLGIMAAAAERLSSMQSNNSSPPSPNATSAKNSSIANASATASSTNASVSTSFQRPKLVLPELTSDLVEDLESTSGKNAHHGNIALSIAKRPQWADYPLKDIVGPPHPHDVCEFVFEFGCIVLWFSIGLGCFAGLALFFFFF